MNWLFDASPFVTRSHCGPGWSPWLIAVSQASNLLTFLAYLSIPYSLYLAHIKRREGLPPRHIAYLFIAFITLCGLTHLADVLVFGWAAYRLFTLVDVLTAAASAATAVCLPGVVADLVRPPSGDEVAQINQQLREEVDRRREAERELAERNAKLKERVSTLTGLLKSNSLKTLEDLKRTNQWIHQRNQAIQELSQILTDLEGRVGLDASVPDAMQDLSDSHTDGEPA